MLGVWRWSRSPLPEGATAGRRTASALVVAGALVLAACLGWEVVRGTTLAGLLDGVVLGPLRHPGEFFFAPELGREAFVTAAAGLGAALAFAWARRRGLTEARPDRRSWARSQLLGGAVLWLGGGASASRRRPSR